MTPLLDVLTTHYDRILDESLMRIRQAIPLYAQLPAEGVRQRLAAGLDPILQDLRDPAQHHYSDYVKQLSYDRVKEGVPFSAVQDGLRVSNQVVLKILRDNLADQPAELADAIEQICTINERGLIAAYAGYEQVQQETIQAQRMVLDELSTPIIPIFKGILVLPIVGSIDSNRAGQIMEALLNQIGETSADIVILDITGVPVIDTSVANYLLHAARAARLLGSNVVLVGIGPEIAQTIVQLGIDLTGITTRANLQSGIEYALDTKGLAIRTK